MNGVKTKETEAQNKNTTHSQIAFNIKNRWKPRMLLSVIWLFFFLLLLRDIMWIAYLRNRPIGYCWCKYAFVCYGYTMWGNFKNNRMKVIEWNCHLTYWFLEFLMLFRLQLHLPCQNTGNCTHRSYQLEMAVGPLSEECFEISCENEKLPVCGGNKWQFSSWINGNFRLE